MQSTRWRTLQHYLRPPSWILRALLLREGRGRKGVRVREEKGGEGKRKVTDLPYDLDDLEMTWLP